jgi:hypothetical protein
LKFLESQEVSSLTSSERDSEKTSGELENQFAKIKNMLSTNEQGDRTKFFKRECASWHKNGKFDLGSIIEISDDDKFGTVKSEFQMGSFGNHSNSNMTNKNPTTIDDGLLSFGIESSAEKQKEKQQELLKKNRKSLWGNPPLQLQNCQTDSVQKNQEVIFEGFDFCKKSENEDGDGFVKTLTDFFKSTNLDQSKVGDGKGHPVGSEFLGSKGS